MPEYHNDGFQLVTLGAVKSDGTPDIANVLFRLPVPHQQMSVRQAVKVDEVEVPGRSGNIKQAVGYEDTEISMDLLLVDEEDSAGNVTRAALEQFQEMQAAFRDRSDPVGETAGTKKAPYAVPTIFSIQSRLTDACGIRTVLFKDLEVTEIPGETSLEVSISLVEFEPVALQVEKRAMEAVKKEEAVQEAKQATGQAGGTTGTTGKGGAKSFPSDEEAEQTHDEEIGEESPLAKAFRQGKADAMGGLPK